MTRPHIAQSVFGFASQVVVAASRGASDRLLKGALVSVMVLSPIVAGCTKQVETKAPETPVAAPHMVAKESAVALTTDPLPEEELVALRQSAALMDRGQINESITILRLLLERHPNHSDVLHELALAYRLNHEPNKAVDLLYPYRTVLPILSLAGLGSALDEAGRGAEAQELLTWALKKYPESRLLYSELGTVLAKAKENKKAAAAYLEGMRVEPSWPSNHLNAAKIFPGLGEHGLAIIEAEIFRNLEPDSQRSKDIARLMKDLLGETLVSVPVGGGRAEIVARLTSAGAPASGTPPLAVVFEKLFGPPLVTAHKSGLSLQSIHIARESFLRSFWSPKSAVPDDVKSTPLFRMQRDMLDAGHFEAYDYWLFAPAFPDEALRWISTHLNHLDAALEYMDNHPLYPKKGAALPGGV